TGTTTVVGTFKGSAGSCGSASSFSLSANQSITTTFEVSYAAAANTGTQALTVPHETVSGTTIVPPFTTAMNGTVPKNAPYAQGIVQVIPVTKFATTLLVGTVPATAIPLGYSLPVKPSVTPPASTPTNNIFYPTARGTGSIFIDGTRVVTAPVTSFAFHSPSISTAGLSVGSHTVKVVYTGSTIYSGNHSTATFTVTTAFAGTAFTCSNATFSNIAASVVASGVVPATTYHSTVSATTVAVTLHADASLVTKTTALSGISILLSPGGGISVASGSPSKSSGVWTVSWTGLTAATIPISGAVGTEVPVGIQTINFAQGARHFTCNATSSAAHIGTVKVAAPPTPVTWSLAGCTSGSTTAPAWANTEKIVANGAGGGGGGAAASATGYGGAGGAGGKVTTTLTIAGSTTVSAKTGCAGKGAPQGGGVVGNGGAAVSGWSSSGKGGQGTYCWYGTPFGTCGLNDGTGGSGGGSTGVCNGASSCTSATTAHAVAVAAGGGGGGESMCSGTNAGSGGQAGNAGTTATSGSKGKGLSGSTGATGAAWAITGLGVAGGPGGANNKSAGSGSATGAAGGNGGAHNSYGDSGAS